MKANLKGGFSDESCDGRSGGEQSSGEQSGGERSETHRGRSVQLSLTFYMPIFGLAIVVDFPQQPRRLKDANCDPYGGESRNI